MASTIDFARQATQALNEAGDAAQRLNQNITETILLGDQLDLQRLNPESDLGQLNAGGGRDLLNPPTLHEQINRSGLS